MKKILFALLSTQVLSTLPALAQYISPPSAAAPAPESLSVSGDEQVIIDEFKKSEPGRKRFFAPRNKRGSTVLVPRKDVAELCGDFDGCTFRIGMYNWANRQMIASRSSLLFFNRSNGNWRVSLGDVEGTDNNNATQHLNHSWGCYFTDGAYENWVAKGDSKPGFGLLPWNQYNAACLLVLID